MGLRAELNDPTARRALAAVERACASDLDPASLGAEVVARARPVLAADAFAFCLTDPQSGAMIDAVASGLSSDAGVAFVAGVYPHEGHAIANQARLREAVRRIDACEPYETADARFFSAPCWEWMRQHGVARDLRSVLSTDRTVWGFWCTMREPGDRVFTPREEAFARRARSSVARAIHRTSAARLARTALEQARAGNASSGVIALDADGRVTLMNEIGRQQLSDLARVHETTPLPTAVLSVAGQVRAAMTTADAPAFASAQIFAVGGSGQVYRVSGSRTAGIGRREDADVVVLIEHARAEELAQMRAMIYGLTARELEVAEFAARGASTRVIADQLGISQYTVQEHLGKAYGKLGVRGRSALVAALFLGVEHSSRESRRP
jgi:DNA-binding CsgD family transcriptional regulator